MAFGCRGFYSGHSSVLITFLRKLWRPSSRNGTESTKCSLSLCRSRTRKCRTNRMRPTTPLRLRSGLTPPLRSGLRPQSLDSRQKSLKPKPHTLKFCSLHPQEHIAGIVSSMDPAQPDIIQCVRASQALGCFGRAFRPAGRGKSRRSFPTNHIQEFWSHSWHGNAWHKVLTALYLYNGMTAAVFASLGTLLLWALVAWSYLPVEPLWWREHPAASFWCTGTSILLYCLALFFSKPRRRVFLDILCIDQEDTSLKAAGAQPDTQPQGT